MRDQEIGLMESEIVEEENTSTPTSKTDEKTKKKIKIHPANILGFLKNLVFSFKKPKIITLFILFASIIVVYAGLTLLSVKQKETEPSIAKIEAESPSPQATIDPDLAQIQKRVEEYNQKLNNLTSLKRPAAPQVNLNIKFE